VWAAWVCALVSTPALAAADPGHAAAHPVAAVAATPATPATPALWGYIDRQGVAHVAPQALDARYQPLLQPAGGLRAAAHGRVAGKTASAGSLLVWLQFAPEVRAVRPWLREAATAHGVDAELMLALIAVESGFNPRAVSTKGALGLMQLMPASADRYAAAGETARPATERMLDPRTNLHTGARMLADLMRRWGRADLALAAWNAGEGHVRRHGNAVPPFRETHAHVELVLELYWALLQRSQLPHATTLNLQAL
jgi:soluble lytic murein transglycosylase-like protein